MYMKSYLLKRIPDDLWEGLKILVDKKGMTLRGLILTLLRKEYEKDEDLQ
uniref:Uncharacterized protein n=1 Tax=viral metagenome TaxID=1070528 RepID=A0A6M3K3Y4_9ZZZZ